MSRLRTIATSISLTLVSVVVFGVPGQAAAPAQKGKDKTLRMWEHRGSVLTMAFTPEGDRLITGGAAHDHGVCIWDFKSGQVVRKIKGAGLVYSLALSPDGKRLATAGYAGILNKKKPEPVARTVVWDTATGKEIFAIKNDLAGLWPCIAYSPDGKTLAAGTMLVKGDDGVGAVQLFDADTGKPKGAPLVGSSESFGRLRFSPDGKSLAAASWGEQTFVVLWNVETRKQIAVLKSKTTWTLIRALAFSADSKRLAWASGNEINNNAEHLIWEVVTGKRLGSLRSKEMTAWIGFHAKTASIYTVGVGGAFDVWNETKFTKTAGFEPEPGLAFPTMVQSAVVSPNGKTLVIGTGNSETLAPPLPDVGTLRIFDVATGRERLSPEREAVRAKDEAAEAARLAAHAKAAKERAEQERQAMAKLPAEVRAKIENATHTAAHLQYALHLQQASQAVERGHLSMAVALLEKYFPKAGQEDLRTVEWRLLWQRCQFQRIEMELAKLPLASWQGGSLRLSPDGKTLAVPTVDNKVNLWDVATGKQGPTLQMPGAVWHIAFAPDGKSVLTAGGRERNPIQIIPPQPEKDDPSSREAIFWDARSGKSLAKFEGSKTAIGSIAIAGNGKLAAVSDWPGGVRIFELPSGKLKTSLTLADDSATVLAFSPDAQTLAVGGANGTVVLFDITAGKQMKLAEAKYNNPINSIQFGPSGDTLYVTGDVLSNNYFAKRWTRRKTEPWKLTREWKLIRRLELSLDGTKLCLSGWHGVHLWDEEDDREIGRILPRMSGAGLGSRMAFAPDSKTVLVYVDSIPGQPQFALFDAATGHRLAAIDDDWSGSLIHLAKGGELTVVGGRDRLLTATHIILGKDVRSRNLDGNSRLFSLATDLLDFRPDSQFLAINDGSSVFTWDLQKDKMVKTGSSNNLPITRVRYSSDGKTLLSTDPSGVKIWDPKTTNMRALVPANYGSIGADRKTLYVAKKDGRIAMFSADDGKALGELTPTDAKAPAKDDEDRGEGGVKSSTSGKWVIGTKPILYDAVAKKESKRWTSDPPPVEFAFTPNDKTLITTDRHGTLTVWDLPKVVQRHVVAKGGHVVAVSPDSRLAVLVQAEGRVILFDLETGAVAAPLTGLSARTSAIAFSPDSRSLVTTGADGLLCFWCPMTGAQRCCLREAVGPISSLAFSPDNTMLAVFSGTTVSVRSVR